MTPEAPNPDIWFQIGGIVAALVAGATGYFGPRILGKKDATPKIDPMLAGIGMALGDRDQTERLIVQVTRIADALTDKNTAGINDRLEELAERIDDMRPPPRRR